MTRERGMRSWVAEVPPVAAGLAFALALSAVVGWISGAFGSQLGIWLLATGLTGLVVPMAWNLGPSVHRAERVRQETALERAAFEESPIGCVVLSRDGHYERVNDAFCTMVGYTADEVLGRGFGELSHVDDREADASAIAAMLRGEQRRYVAEKRYMHRDGHAICVCAYVTTLLDEHGEVSQFLLQVQDVTDSRRTAKQLEESQFEMLTRLATAAELRDDETGDHTRRVGELAGRVAQRVGLDADEHHLIRLAAPLHDVGKLGIPDGILLKPGRLSEEEFDRVKSHTTIGARMLSGATFPLLAAAEEIALTHHERWDGGGYPKGLSGEDIPLSGRIVAVADVFDALTHDRPYKSAWPRERAIREIVDGRGRQFDPVVVDAFLRVVAEEGPVGRLPDEVDRATRISHAPRSTRAPQSP